MKKILLSALMMLSVACGGADVVQPETAAQVAEHNAPTVDIGKMRNQTIILVDKTDSEYTMYCSGVWISPTQVLTAHHCVLQGALESMEEEDAIAVLEGEEPAPKLEGWVLNYRTHADYLRDHQSLVSQRARNIRVVAVEAPTDLALLEIEGPVPPHDVAELHSGEVKDASFVWALGHSAGLLYTVSYGVVSASRRNNDLTILQVSVPVSGGNSGGGVYDLNGQLVGIVSSMLRTANQVTFATHRDSIKEFVDSNGGVK